MITFRKIENHYAQCPALAPPPTPAGPPVFRGPDSSSLPYTAPLAQPAPAGAPEYFTKVDERSDRERVISEYFTKVDEQLQQQYLLVDHRARKVIPSSCHLQEAVPPDGPPPLRLYGPLAPPYPPPRSLLEDPGWDMASQS